MRTKNKVLVEACKNYGKMTRSDFQAWAEAVCMQHPELVENEIFEVVDHIDQGTPVAISTGTISGHEGTIVIEEPLGPSIFASIQRRKYRCKVVLKYDDTQETMIHSFGLIAEDCTEDSNLKNKRSGSICIKSGKVGFSFGTPTTIVLEDFDDYIFNDNDFWRGLFVRCENGTYPIYAYYTDNSDIPVGYDILLFTENVADVDLDDIPLFSMENVIDTLSKYSDDNQIYDFVSDLTGISVDALCEKVHQFSPQNSADAKITKEMIEDGIKNGTVQFIVDPNLDQGTVCNIGDYWFYFNDLAEEMNPTEYLINVDKETLIKDILGALDGLKENGMEDEYRYYYGVIAEKGTEQ